jgi:uncharacterized protein (DUF1015 family)
MATVEPFQGIRYNPQKVPSLAEVVAPPYDVITPQQQAEYYGRSPYNIIRVELGRVRPDDDENENAHSRARIHLRQWQNQAVLIRDPEPSFYLVATAYAVRGQAFTRWGLIAQVGLEPFSAQGQILPHEQTFPEIKSERLSLMRACGLNTSPIFSLCNDPDGIMQRLSARAAKLDPALAFHDDTGALHRMWRLTDPAENQIVQDAFRNKRLYIADGHHRYETCLAYRDACFRSTGHIPERHPANGTLMYISSMQDPGLQVLPTHRVLPQVEARLRREFITRAQKFFDCQTLFVERHDPDQAINQLCATLEELPAEVALGVAIRGDAGLHCLRLKPDATDRIYAAGVPSALRQLNVTLLTEFVLPQLLEMNTAALEDANRIRFKHSAASSIRAVRRGDYDMAFLLRATPVAQVRAIAESGLSMPRKTTYFAPKVITGLVMRSLEPVA